MSIVPSCECLRVLRVPALRLRCDLLLTGLGFIAAFCTLAGCSQPDETATATAGSKHVLVISMDTTRGDHFGFMGNPSVKTPHLDALAAQSIVMDGYSTVVPTTLASHTTLLTGNYPHHHGVPRNGFMVNKENLMLAEVLKDRGYQTAGFIGSFALESRFDFAQGFDHFDETFEVMVGDNGADQNQRPADSVTDAVLSYLDGASSDDPHFLFVHYFDPHAPYEAPPPFDRAYDPTGRAGLLPIDRVRGDRDLDGGERLQNARRWMAQYASEISYMDSQIGRLLDGLRDRGILDEAVLVLTSDHGESLWEHNEPFDHGRNVYEATIQAVCLFRLPGGQHAGSRVRGLTSTIDVFPTLLSVLGLPIPESVDGEVIPLDPPGEVDPARLVFAQATKPWRNVESDPRWRNMLKSRFVRQGKYKLIRTPYTRLEELFDLEADPQEQTNLLVSPTPEVLEVAERLRPQLEAWAKSARPLESHFESSQQEETMERLRSLGYIR